MSETFIVKSSIKDYEVCCVDKGGALSRAKNYQEFVIIDEKVKSLWPVLNIENPLQVEAIENNMNAPRAMLRAGFWA